MATLANERQTEELRRYVPTQMQPVTSKETLFNQMLQYQLKRASLNSPIQVLNARFNMQSESKSTTYEIRPLDTKAWINYENTVTANLAYKPWSQQTELSISPSQKIARTRLALSHVMAPNDQRDMLVVSLEW